MNNTSFDSTIINVLQGIKTHPRETYQIIDKLGEGTYGAVYKAINKITDQLVAIKICPINEDEEVYYNEFEFLRSVDHPCIVKLVDAYATTDELWLVLEYCQLGSVADILQLTGIPFSEAEIACVIYHLLLALEFIHAQDSMHRDLKPGNILINSTGEVKLADFGIASTKSQTNTFIGSPLWMAPEQAAKQFYTKKVDIWALGICILEMAELETPFQHLHPARVIFAIEHRPQLTFQNPENFSSLLRDFLSKCFVVKSESRASASELQAHPFILQHKPDFESIKKDFSEKKSIIIKNSRMKQALLASAPKSGKPENNFLEGIADKDNSNSILSEIKKPKTKSSIISNEQQTFIEKSSLAQQTFIEKPSFVNDSQDSNLNFNPKSQLIQAIQQLRKENKQNFSGTQNISKEIIASGGGPFTRESIASVIRISSYLEQNNTSNNVSINSNIGIVHFNKENLKKNSKENSFVYLNNRKFSPLPTYEGDEIIHSNNRSRSSIKSEKAIDLKSRLKLDLGSIPKVSSDRSHAQSTKKKNYKHIQISNFIVGKGKQHHSQPASLDVSSDSDVPPISCDRVTSRPISKRRSYQNASPNQVSARQLAQQNPLEVLETEHEETEKEFTKTDESEGTSQQRTHLTTNDNDFESPFKVISPVFVDYKNTDKFQGSMGHLSIKTNIGSDISVGLMAQPKLTPSWSLHLGNPLVYPNIDHEKLGYSSPTSLNQTQNISTGITNDSKNLTCMSSDRKARLEEEEGKFSLPVNHNTNDDSFQVNKVTTSNAYQIENNRNPQPYTAGQVSFLTTTNQRRVYAKPI